MKIRLMNNLFIGFFILLLIPFSYIAAYGLEQHTSLILKKEIPVGNESKIDSDIRQKIENKTSDLSRWSVPSENNEIGVYIYLDSKSDKIPENIPIFSRAEDIIYSKLSPHQIRALADLPNVKRIGFPIRASIYDNSVSEGVNFSFANQMHSLGYTGSGVTVAVIDSGFFPLNPEISSNVESTSFGPTCGNITCGDSDGHSHGTAVSEVVVDMAPDVRLRLYAGLDLIDTLNALDSAIASHVKIITMSIGFPSLGGDGTTGYFRDGTSLIAKKVNDARNAGILVTVASGNSGQSSWSGTYLASEVSPSTIGLQDYQSLMNFRPSLSGIQQTCLPVTDNGDGYYVSWNDWDLSDQDYDLYAFNSSFTAFYGQSIGSQTGFEPPIEGFLPHPPSGGVCLVLASWSSSQNHFFHIDALGNSIDPSVLVKAGSL
ncbi:MAG TPA: S8 family serine peptidase, partial [Nitrosopumilaceae archaeon]|nr:S8 family serine peptidase [Nitrosopumilaceae archaeon]